MASSSGMDQVFDPADLEDPQQFTQEVVVEILSRGDYDDIAFGIEFTEYNWGSDDFERLWVGFIGLIYQRLEGLEAVGPDSGTNIVIPSVSGLEMCLVRWARKLIVEKCHTSGQELADIDEKIARLHLFNQYENVLRIQKQQYPALIIGNTIGRILCSEQPDLEELATALESLWGLPDDELKEAACNSAQAAISDSKVGSRGLGRAIRAQAWELLMSVSHYLIVDG